MRFTCVHVTYAHILFVQTFAFTHYELQTSQSQSVGTVCMYISVCTGAGCRQSGSLESDTETGCRLLSLWTESELPQVFEVEVQVPFSN